MEKHSEGEFDSTVLRELGYSEAYIHEAERRWQSGAARYTPDKSLVEQTIARCAVLLPSQSATTPGSDAQDVLIALIRMLLSPNAGSFVAALQTGLKLLTSDPTRQYLKALGFALKAHKRPLLMVANYNLIKPAMWGRDQTLALLRTTVRGINKVVTFEGIPPSALVLVLRPDVSSYDRSESREIRNLVRGTTSDVWCIPANEADEYADQNLVVVMGDTGVLKATRKAGFPEHLLGATERIEDTQIVAETRREIEQTISRARPIKIGGRLEKQEAPGGRARDEFRAAVASLLQPSAN